MNKLSLLFWISPVSHPNYKIFTHASENIHHFLSMLKNDSILKMSCSFFPEDSHCGPAPGKEDFTIVPVKSCANNIFDRLSALGVSGKTQSGNTQIVEAEVLFNRGLLYKRPAKFLILLKH